MAKYAQMEKHKVEERQKEKGNASYKSMILDTKTIEKIINIIQIIKRLRKKIWKLGIQGKRRWSQTRCSLWVDPRDEISELLLELMHASILIIKMGMKAQHGVHKLVRSRISRSRCSSEWTRRSSTTFTRIRAWHRLGKVKLCN